MNFSIDNQLQIKPMLLVVMGVSGCGKSTLAAALSRFLGWSFQEGDALHSPANIKKMSQGKPLSDKDRWPWLEKCHEWLLGCEKERGGQGILTCSALKRSYRDFLRQAIQSPFYFLYLDVPYHELQRRLKARKGHFMPAHLLDSQLDSLEAPQPDEPFLRVEVACPPKVVVQDALNRLQKLSLESGSQGDVKGSSQPR